MLAAFFLFITVATVVGYMVLKDGDIDTRYEVLREDYEKALDIMCSYLGYDANDGHKLSDLAKQICNRK